MKFKRNYIFCAVIGAFLAISLACGGASNTSSNANNSNASAKSNASNASNQNSAAPVSDKPPATIEAGQFTTSELSELRDSPGRMVTASGNLVFVSEGEKELTLSSAKAPASGTPFSEVACKGDFAKYSGIKDKITDATKKLSPPRATVKGTVAKEQNQEGVLILEPCVMSDLKANP